jgi:RNA polymerase sigma-70 factor (ECF subfamily)
VLTDFSFNRHSMSRPHVEAVLEDVAPGLLRYFLRRTGGPEDAADLLSETLTEAWRVSRRMPKEHEAARMWVFGVARNTLRHYVRGEMRRDALVSALGYTIAQVTGEVSDDDLDVQNAVSSLSDELAELIRLVHWDGFTLEQAAGHLGIPPSTARSRHSRAKQMLRDTLAETAAPRP